MKKSNDFKTVPNYSVNGVIQVIATTKRSLCLMFQNFDILKEMIETIGLKYQTADFHVIESFLQSINDQNEGKEYSSQELEELFKPNIISVINDDRDLSKKQHIKQAEIILLSLFEKYNDDLFCRIEKIISQQCESRKIFGGKRIIILVNTKAFESAASSGKISGKTIFESNEFKTLNPFVISVR